jgi:hypothetical protein
MCSKSYRAIIDSDVYLRVEQEEAGQESNQPVYFFKCKDGTSTYQFGLMRGLVKHIHSCRNLMEIINHKIMQCVSFVDW